MKRIALYGLSADPLHDGHRAIIRQLYKCDDFDMVYVWVVNNPSKKHHSSLEHRSNELEDFVQSETDIKFKIVVNQEYSDKFTMISADKVRKDHPSDKLYVIIGSDVKLKTWKHLDKLHIIDGIAVISMKGYTSTYADYGTIFFTHRAPLTEYIVLKFDIPDISSTNIRKMALEIES